MSENSAGYVELQNYRTNRTRVEAGEADFFSVNELGPT